MAKFKLSISTADGMTKSLEIEGLQAQQFIGKRIGESIGGAVLEMPNVELLITGGSDKDGFPMRQDVHGGVRKAIMLSGGTGFRAKTKGARRRKIVRGNVITDDIVQVSLKILKKQH